MSRARPLLVALPAFVLGSLVTAALTSTARGQNTIPPQPVPRLHWTFKVVDSERELNRWGEMGYEYCGQSSAASAAPNTESSLTTYTMRKAEAAFPRPRLIGGQ